MKRIFTEEHRRKLSESHKGQKPTNLEQLRLYRKGKPLSYEHKKKIGDAQIGKFVSEETRLKIGLSGKGRVPHNKGIGNEDINCIICNTIFSAKKTQKRKFCSIACFRVSNKTNGHYRYINDRTKLSKKQKRNDSSYREWRISVYKRDWYKCKIHNDECEGRIEAHHILPWKNHEELRYEVSNGITLCHFHHPKTRELEKSNIQLFQSLIA